ncbi:siaz-interacting nuclear protein [Myxocyprinus asiaticus]|uniref:siaz-interacting nuclear protein n=1 Tax=Myxocyprinus asiaticus TaxID=70543 RepID=UPI002223CDB1|nr:siaz-interacting nuclear protein [Myxocyprinus asiaticus]
MLTGTGHHMSQNCHSFNARDAAERVERERSPLENWVKYWKVTRVQPFSFDVRDAARRVERERRLRQMREMQEQQWDFSHLGCMLLHEPWATMSLQSINGISLLKGIAQVRATKMFTKA